MTVNGANGWTDLLFTLLLKVSAAASLAALLVRYSTFRKVLYTEIRDADLKLKLMLFLTPPLALGVTLRLFGHPYRFADLMLEGSFLLGLLGGLFAGPLGGALISLPALFHQEWLSTPMAVAAGLVGGLVRQVMPNKEDIWSFGPFTFLNAPRSLVRLLRERRIPWEMLPMTLCAGLEVARIAVGAATASAAPLGAGGTSKHPLLFYVAPNGAWQYVLLVFATTTTVAVFIKIWNNTRIEMNLEQHQQLLLRARMDALTSQINPHFLFNTLNTVASLIRYDPDTARVVLVKLSNILRRLLRKHETFVALREELDFIDDYLDIEVVRFGREKLQIVKHVAEPTLDAFVPSMLLQPIVENSLKHGLAGKLEGGEISIRTALHAGRLVVEVEDNGVGIPKERMPQVYAEGIGISNVHERLKLLYGDDFKMDIASRAGQGTCIRIEVPEVVPTMPVAS
jgi:two-component system, LytTR family, sensor kinase